MQDRRDFPRHSCQVEVAFSHLHLDLLGQKCIGHNICAGGMNLILDKSLDEGHMLSLSFLLPDEKIPVSTTGRVAWVQDLGDEKYHAGIEFDNITISDQAKIISFVVKNEPFFLYHNNQ